MMRLLVATIAATILASQAQAADPFRKTLISARANVNPAETEISGHEVAPGLPISWSVRKTRLHGGKQEGVDLVTIDNGRLRIVVVPTRGMGILSVTMGDVRLGWDSPVREVVHPAFVNLQSRGGLGWLEGFNEWMCRCGMEWSGHPGTDRFINNVGDEATMELTLHGRVANLPAQEVELVADREPPYRIRLRARIDERMFYGPKLELVTELSTEAGSAALRIADVITNCGPSPQEFQMLYHCNFGRTLLEDGSALVAAVERVTPFNDHAAKSVATYDRYTGPTDGFIEQVYCIRPCGDADGRTLAMLRNKAADRAASLAWSIKELPYLTLWKNLAAEKDGYVTGIEPGTSFPTTRRIERKAGRVPRLAPGESRAMTIDVAVHVGADEVNRVADRIAAIQAGRPVVLDKRPAKVK